MLGRSTLGEEGRRSCHLAEAVQQRPKLDASAVSGLRHGAALVRSLVRSTPANSFQTERLQSSVRHFNLQDFGFFKLLLHVYVCWMSVCMHMCLHAQLGMLLLDYL